MVTLQLACTLLIIRVLLLLYQNSLYYTIFNRYSTRHVKMDLLHLDHHFDYFRLTLMEIFLYVFMVLTSVQGKYSNTVLERPWTYVSISLYFSNSNLVSDTFHIDQLILPKLMWYYFPIFYFSSYIRKVYQNKFVDVRFTTFIAIIIYIIRLYYLFIQLRQVKLHEWHAYNTNTILYKWRMARTPQQLKPTTVGPFNI